MILTKEAEVKVNGKTIKYYESLGYNIPTKKASYNVHKTTGKDYVYDLNKTFTVKIKDLQKNSEVKIEALCDYCNKEILTMTYDQYTQRTKDVDKIACRNKECYTQKAKEVSLLRHGVDNYAKTKECRQKMESTMMRLYGVKNPLQSLEIKEKSKQTCIERYGTEYALQSEEVKEKKRNTLFEHYQVDVPAKHPTIKRKISESMYKNSSQKASKQQTYLCNLYQGELNYPIEYYDADICLSDEKIVVEYDGSGHNLNVKLGKITEEEFNQRELVRYNVIKRKGYKQMRIIALHDKLPSDAILFQMLLIAREYFNTTHHNWINFDIDNSKIINAENKDADGVFFNYGKLYSIKNADIKGVFKVEKIVFTDESLKVVTDKIKENKNNLSSHANNKSNPHGVTLSQLGLGAAGSALGLVKSGGDVTISSGVITVNDDSHNHTIANIDNLQASLDAKQATVTGGASTITSSNLTANRALISNGSGKVAVSAVTSTELGYLDGVTSAIQGQLDGKAASSHGNHVPATQTANNAKFLRNDNTWQTVTPANIGAATSGHTHISLSGWSDTRNVNTTPNDYNSKFTISGLKSNSTIGLSNGGTYSGVVGFRSWSDSSGGNSQEIAFAANGNLYRRHGATTEWGDWLQFIDSGNISSQSVASATKATQDASGNVITSTYETKANASSKLTEAKTYTDTVASGKANASHTHSYAGSSSVGGSATSAVKLDTSTAGDANTPVYFSGGKPVACTSLDLNTSGSSASCTGNSATATKLQTARTIGLGTGATGTATSFNGTGNITIPVTDVKESYLSWGGKNISGGVSPIDAACSNIHSANRFAFAKAAGITIEYSTNGSTYSAYSTTDAAKVNLVSGNGNTYYIGARSSSTTVNDKLRITLNATNMGLYTRLRKLLINISTSYATGCNVIIEKAMKGSETTFTTIGTYQISGWSGWNSIPINAAFGGGSNQTGNIAVLRLTFGITGVNSEQTSNALSISDIIGIGDTYWSYPSTMAKTGHIYTYDSSQNTTFPANVTATTFVGALSGNASTATTATNVAWSGVTSKPSYYDAKAIKGITRSGTTFTYTCMDGTTGTFTQQDNNTDTKVTNTLATTTKAYVTGTTSASTNTGTQVFDTGVYLDTTAGQLTATTFNGTTFSGSGVATLAEVKTYLGI